MLEQLLAQLLRSSPNTKILEAIEGKIISFEISNVPFHSSFCLLNQAVVKPPISETPHLQLKGPLKSYLAFGLNPKAPINPEGLTIQGDVFLAQHLQTLFNTLAIDWEEFLSQYLGDFWARELCKQSKRLNTQRHSVLQAMETTLIEYLRFESDCLPTKDEVNHFMLEVDTLRSDTARLEARIQQLKSALCLVD